MEQHMQVHSGHSVRAAASFMEHTLEGVVMVAVVRVVVVMGEMD